MKNPFEDAKKVTQFKSEADAWSLCLKEAKRNGVYINHTPWSDADLLLIIRQLRFGKKGGWLCFIEDS